MTIYLLSFRNSDHGRQIPNDNEQGIVINSILWKDSGLIMLSSNSIAFVHEKIKTGPISLLHIKMFKWYLGHGHLIP